MAGETPTLTQEQREGLIAMISEFTRAELGPLVKEIVEEQIQKSSNVTGAANVAQLVQALKGTPHGRDEQKGQAFGRIVRALASSKGDPERAGSFARKSWGDGDEVVKALAAGEATAGGFIVPPEYSDEIIELLTPMTAVRSLGARVLPMTNGNLQVPKITAGASAFYIGENANITKSQQTFGMLNLVSKKLAALVPLSNDLIRFSRPSADSIVRDDVLRALRVKEDVTFIRSLGTQATPKGLKGWTPAANVIAVNATVNLANVTIDLGKLILALMNADVQLIQPGWIMAPRTWNYLMTVRDGNGNFAFRDEMLQGRLWGYPFRVTTQIPINLAVTGTNESEIYFADFADVVIGEASSVEIAVTSEGAYNDGTGLVAAFSTDQTVVRVIVHHDFGMRHEESVAYLKDVDWQ